MWPAIIGGAAISAIGGLIGQHQMRNTMQGVQGKLAPWKEGAEKYQKLSDDYMSIDSGINQDLRRNIFQGAADMGAQGSRMNQRMLSSGGLGGYSGLQQQNQNEMYSQLMSNAEDSFQSAFSQNRNYGVGLLDSYVKNLKAYGETMAQGQIQNDSMRASMVQSAVGGLGQGLMDFGFGQV